MVFPGDDYITSITWKDGEMRPLNIISERDNVRNIGRNDGIIEVPSESDEEGRDDFIGYLNRYRRETSANGRRRMINDFTNRV